MNKTHLQDELLGRGVSEKNLAAISTFAQQAEIYVFPKSRTVEDAVLRQEELIGKALPSGESIFLKALLRKYLQSVSPQVRYTEEGYDSCQVHREISKMVSHLLCIGNLWQEAHDYLNIALSVADIQQLIGSDLVLTGQEIIVLGQISRQIGAQQDFLFPGVTRSSEDVPDLETFALETILGNPRISVRHLTGVGGLRFDRDWNYCLSLSPFTQKKVEEDKRFYPGSGIAYMLLHGDTIASSTALQWLQSESRASFRELEGLIGRLKNQSVSRTDVSLIHSAYAPTSGEFFEARSCIMDNPGSLHARLGEAFHSPSYQYGYWKAFGESLSRKDHQQLSFSLEEMGRAHGLFSFNSPIHLPWCVELSDLTHRYIGRITNRRGEYAIRYGVGLAETGTSVEVRFYEVKSREGIWGTAARLINYDDVLFTRERGSRWITSKDAIIPEVEQVGFLLFAARLCATVPRKVRL